MPVSVFPRLRSHQFARWTVGKIHTRRTAISSSVTSLTPPNTAIYTGTKGAVDAITGVLAKELGSRNIRVNAINPGLIETEGSQSLGSANVESDMRKWVESTASLGRIGQVDDIAPTAVYFASDDSKYMTGQILAVSGGM